MVSTDGDIVSFEDACGDTLDGAFAALAERLGHRADAALIADCRAEVLPATTPPRPMGLRDGSLGIEVGDTEARRSRTGSACRVNPWWGR